jgi:hypothetical protein
MSGDSAAVPSATGVLLPPLRMFVPGSSLRSAVRRMISILTMPSILLQIGRTDSYVPLSLCVRMYLRGCGVAKNGLFGALERPLR